MAENRYPFTTGKDLAPMLALAETKLAVTGGPVGTLLITNIGAKTALYVRLDDGRELSAPGWAYFSANHFCLLPGEQRSVQIDWSPTTESKRIEIKGWNTEVVTIG